MEKNCEVCDAPMVVFDANDPDKPLRCSDSCPENRKSIAERGVALTDEDVEDEKNPPSTAKRKKK